LQGSFKASKFNVPGESPVIYPESKVEVRGFMARHYDALLDLVTFGFYRYFIKEAISWLDIQKSDRIIDLGAGTGRNACLMVQHLSESGKIVGIDVSNEMAAQFIKRCRNFPNVSFLRQRIDIHFELNETFDKALLSFVFHGFPQEVRETILDNCFNLLKPGGKLILLDYNEFSPDSLPWYLRYPFKITECPYAYDFIQRDMAKLLAQHGFSRGNERLFFKGMVRCLQATREACR